MDARGHFRRLRTLMAVLATVALVVACDDELAGPITISGTGSVEGLVFFDRGEDGVFDPADGDQALAGVNIAIQDRGAGQTFSGGTGQSGSDGRFQISGLPPGTHDMLIDTLSVAAGISICQNPLQVTVNLSETRFANVQGRPGCLITIGAAKDLALGDFVIVKGIVTSFPGQIESSVSYLQDASAGSKIFSSALDGAGLEVGDQIEIGGIVEEFSNDFNFESVVLRSVVKGVGALTPMSVTTAAVGASGSDWTHPIQGALIKLSKTELTGAFGSIGNSQNAPIDDGSGGTIMRVDDGVADRGSLNSLLSVGTCYDIVGFGANFNGAGQIFPRSMDDIQEVPCS